MKPKSAGKWILCTQAALTFGFGSANVWCCGTEVVGFWMSGFAIISKSHLSDAFISGNKKPSSFDFGERFLNPEKKYFVNFRKFISHNDQLTNKPTSFFFTSLIDLVLSPQHRSTLLTHLNQYAFAFFNTTPID